MTTRYVKSFGITIIFSNDVKSKQFMKLYSTNVYRRQRKTFGGNGETTTSGQTILNVSITIIKLNK